MGLERRQDESSPPRQSAALAETMLLWAFVLYGVTIGRSTPVAGLLVFLATCALVASVWLRTAPNGPASEASPTTERRLFIGILLLGVLGFLGWSPSSIGPTSPVVERAPGLVWIALGWLAMRAGADPHRRVHKAVLGVTLCAALLFGLLHLSAAKGVGYDVLFLHEQAAAALARGQNPYTDAVEVLDGSPTAQPGDVISGYVYPPVTGIAYSIGEWLLDDPRYVSLVAWLTVLGILGYRAARRGSTQGLLATILLASLPGWPLVLRAAWTEPLSLAFLLAAFAVWRRPVASGLWAGLALASKQYFVVSAPFLLLQRSPGWRTRSLAALTMIVATVGAALLWDAGAFWSAAVEFHVSTSPRPDSVNLVGLSASFGRIWDPPTALALGLGLLTAALLSRRVHDGESFLLSLAAALAVSFLVTTQAFANYWFLIAGLCCIGLSATNRPEAHHDLALSA